MTEEEQKGLKLLSLYLVLGTLLGKIGTIIGHNSNIIEKIGTLMSKKCTKFLWWPGNNGWKAWYSLGLKNFKILKNQGTPWHTLLNFSRQCHSGCFWAMLGDIKEPYTPFFIKTYFLCHNLFRKRCWGLWTMFRAEKMMLRPPGNVRQAARILWNNNACPPETLREQGHRDPNNQKSENSEKIRGSIGGP